MRQNDKRQVTLEFSKASSDVVLVYGDLDKYLEKFPEEKIAIDADIAAHRRIKTNPLKDADYDICNSK